jgi:hypothetical protein
LASSFAPFHSKSIREHLLGTYFSTELRSEAALWRGQLCRTTEENDCARDGAGVWVRMQAAYDTWHAEREEDVSGIPTLRPRAA